MVKVHYERYLGAENWARMTGRSIVEALRDLYGDGGLTLPGKNMDHLLRFEWRRVWNERVRNGEAQHHTWAYVEKNA